VLFVTEVTHHLALLVISWDPQTSSCVNKLHLCLYLLCHLRCTGNVLLAYSLTSGLIVLYYYALNKLYLT